MTKSVCAPTAEPFFMSTGSGKRFCIFHAPHSNTDSRGSFVYVHPFAEEMNRSRRMAALQARSFAEAGFAVLQIDLFGCGDSSGEFGEARWQIWKEDLEIASTWLERRTQRPIGLWGLRLGALLALDFATEASRTLDKLLLWQPVINGEAFLTQFLRTRVASEILAGRDGNAIGTQKLRDALTKGECVEVSGYDIAPALAASIDSANAASLAPRVPVHWFELVPETGRPIPPAAARVVSTWQQGGVDLRLDLVAGPTFWATQEITECLPLVAATTNAFSEALS
jgi:exosortase A-associated hydrolase 2